MACETDDVVDLTQDDDLSSWASEDEYNVDNKEVKNQSPHIIFSNSNDSQDSNLQDLGLASGVSFNADITLSGDSSCLSQSPVEGKRGNLLSLSPSSPGLGARDKKSNETYDDSNTRYSSPNARGFEDGSTLIESSSKIMDNRCQKDEGKRHIPLKSCLKQKTTNNLKMLNSVSQKIDNKKEEGMQCRFQGAYESSCLRKQLMGSYAYREIEVIAEKTFVSSRYGRSILSGLERTFRVVQDGCLHTLPNVIWWRRRRWKPKYPLTTSMLSSFPLAKGVSTKEKKKQEKDIIAAANTAASVGSVRLGDVSSLSNIQPDIKGEIGAIIESVEWVVMIIPPRQFLDILAKGMESLKILVKQARSEHELQFPSAFFRENDNRYTEPAKYTGKKRKRQGRQRHCKLIVVVQGVQKEIAKFSSVSNSDQSSRLSMKAVERAVAHLYCNDSCEIHLTESSAQTIQYLTGVTRILAERPYKTCKTTTLDTFPRAKITIQRAREVAEASTALKRAKTDDERTKAEARINVRSKALISATWIAMLQTIPGVSFEKASSIAEKYPSLYSLSHCPEYLAAAAALANRTTLSNTIEKAERLLESAMGGKKKQRSLSRRIFRIIVSDVAHELI